MSFLSGHILIMMDDLGENEGQIAGFHMEKLGAAANLHASAAKIDQLHWFVQMRGHVLNRSYINFKIRFILINRIHGSETLPFYPEPVIRYDLAVSIVCLPDLPDVQSYQLFYLPSRHFGCPVVSIICLPDLSDARSYPIWPVAFQIISNAQFLSHHTGNFNSI